MLIVIVITAAVALAAFVANYQKQLQSEEAYEEDRSLENLRVLSVVPSIDPSNGDLYNATFTVANLGVNPTTVKAVWIDDSPLLQYEAYELNTSTGLYEWITVADGGDLTLGAQEVLSVTVNDTAGSPSYSFVAPGPQLLSTSFIKVELFTAYDNDFTQTFIPPTAIAVVSTLSVYSGGSYVTQPVFDGTESFQPAGNGTLVSWTWSVTHPSDPSCTDPTRYTGEKVVPTVSCGGTYQVLLTVENSDGLEGISSTSYTITPQMSESPSSGVDGSQVTFTGNGYADDSLVTVSGGAGGPPCTNMTNALGGFLCTVTISNSAMPGAYAFTGTDGMQNSATDSFTVTP